MKNETVARIDAVTITLSDKNIDDLAFVKANHANSSTKTIEQLATEAINDGIKQLVRLRVERPSSIKDMKAKTEQSVAELQKIIDALASKDQSKVDAVLAKYTTAK